jgi:hypothetical protein
MLSLLTDAARTPSESASARAELKSAGFVSALVAYPVLAAASALTASATIKSQVVSHGSMSCLRCRASERLRLITLFQGCVLHDGGHIFEVSGRASVTA